VHLKLSRLSALAKRSSVFDDHTAEIDNLTAAIKQELQQVNASISDLQRAAAAQHGGGSRQAGEHAAAVVDALRGRLKDATAEFKEVGGG
jgi:syntaxin 5